MDITPDLSHLTDEEKQIIQAVIHRQKVEDKFDESDDNYDYSAPASSRTPHRYSQINDFGVICQICEKTKFVNEQSSRQCSICKKRFCVRCGIRLKSQYYLCNQCRQKQEQYFSSKKNISKQYSSDYILSRTYDENPLNKYGANQKRILPKLKSNENDEEISSPESISTCDKNKRLLPEIKQDILRDFQYHSLEDRDIGQESTLKDSGIDTASSSTILNVISSEQFKKPMTYWRFNESRTEQIGYVYLKNNLSKYEYDENEIFNTLGLQIQSEIPYENETITEITKVIPGSIADTYGQLRIGDQILEWNEEKLRNLHTNDVNRLICQLSMQSPYIHLIVKRSIQPFKSTNDHLIPNNKICQEQSTIENNSIQLQISFRYDQKHLHVMIYGAKHIPIQQGLFACQLSLQHGRDILSKEEKCTKAQSCISGQCTWNQDIIFFDIDIMENIVLFIKLINLEHNEEVLGEIKFNKLNLNNKSEWYNLNDSSCNRVLPSTSNNRKRQLPDIPVAQLHAKREEVSQDLYQKATELKLRLYMQSTNQKSSLLTQRSFDQTNMVYDNCNPRKSMINLSSTLKGSSTTNLKEKPRIPLIRDKSAPSTGTSRRSSVVKQNENDLEKIKGKSFDEKCRKTIKKLHSADTSGDDNDSDGLDLYSSKVSSTSMLSSQPPERPRPNRKNSIHTRSTDQFVQNNEIQLNEEELRQIEMRSYDTAINPTINNTQANTTVTTLPAVSNEKLIKTDQRNDGTVSDSVLSSPSDTTKKRRPSKQSKAFVILGLSKKANSASNFGFGKRSGFQRSEEIGVQPHLRNRALEKQTSKENDTPASAPPINAAQSPFNTSLQRDQYHSMPHDMKLWSGALKLPHEHQFTEFIEGLGAGQLVGRQVLASPCHGELQIGLRDQQGLLEVEIVRARQLLQKACYKMPPAPYVKVYLLDGKTCIEKQRTRATRRTLDPLIQQALVFKEYYRRRILQISIWGDYGKLDRKVFMGVCQINLEDINLNSSQQILDWYKLFSANSLINNYAIVQQSSKKYNSLTTIDKS